MITKSVISRLTAGAFLVGTFAPVADAQTGMVGVKVQTMQRKCRFATFTTHKYDVITTENDHPSYDQWGADFDLLNPIMNDLCDIDPYRNLTEEVLVQIAPRLINVDRCARMEAAFIATREWSKARYYTYRELVNLQEIRAIVQRTVSPDAAASVVQKTASSTLGLLALIFSSGSRVRFLAEEMETMSTKMLIKEISKERAKDYLQDKAIDTATEPLAENIRSKFDALNPAPALQFNPNDCAK